MSLQRSPSPTSVNGHGTLSRRSSGMNLSLAGSRTIFRSKAPLRIGLAGGGTDVSPYCDIYGGAILNACISLAAHASIELLPTVDGQGRLIQLVAMDQNQSEEHGWKETLPLNGTLDLLKGVYNRVQKDYGVPEMSFRITTFVDAPAGSGLGTSSTLVVAILGAFVEMLKLPLGEYDIAHYAYEIEREDLKLAGGKQDQYAATFGGINYMEFFSDNVVVNPLRIRQEILFELENNLLLYFTSTSRESAKIIQKQQDNVTGKNVSSIDAMHALKEQARQMKEALLKGRLMNVGSILDFGFQQKRKMAAEISNDFIESIYNAAKEAGAAGGKISGAGGGGFMVFYCPGNSRYKVSQSLQKFGGVTRPFTFAKHGMSTWTMTFD
jgi:D-glycero-alpha-D-manno-heptose-7-phosphate kinase